MEDRETASENIAKTDTNHRSERQVIPNNELNDTELDQPLQNVCQTITYSNVEIASKTKRKRLHMDATDCDEHARSQEGAVPLINPHSMNPKKDVNIGLHPVIRNKRKRINDSMDFQDGNFLAGNLSQGFVTASDMYNFSSNKSDLVEVKNNSVTNELSSKSRREKQVKQIPMQGNLLNFFTSTSITNNSSSVAKCSSKNADKNQDKSDTKTTRTLMYSPIKKVSGTDSNSCIYISDSPSNSPTSSQSQSSSQNSVPSENAVVKKLFDAAKNFDSKANHKSRRQKTKGSAFKNDKQKLQEEATKYFESNSFDMESAFASDMEDSIVNETKTEQPSTDNIVEDKYGLLGSGSYPKQDKINYFEMLPFEVLENIFCQLPMLDLCLNSNRVCMQWNNIIADEKFVPWKKLYHKLKADVGDSRVYMQRTMHKHNMKTPATYLNNLIRYMKNFKPVTALNMLQCLEKHSKYCWAKGLIEERLNDCLTHGSPNPWSVVTILVIVAHNVYEIQEIIRCLSVSSSQCTYKEIIECLYCIASFLYAFKLAKSTDVWNGMHYRLFYALYLFENTSASSCSDLQSVMSESKGQQSLVKYSAGNESVRLTHEQLRIVKHKAGPKEVIKIVAFAGTGKTTTLVRYTQLRPDKKFLLVVYNKSVCDHAKNKFPRNVECRTGHSLAYQIFGRRYQHKLFNLKVYTLTQNLKARKGENLFIQAKNVLSTLESFFASADTNIDIQHVPETKIHEKTGLKIPIDLQSKQGYAQDARYIWERMKNFNDKKIGMTHDGYLKLYQLSQPKLRGYDCILIDEAQDLTPAIIDILLHQWQGKILVGDPHQQIYSFRGAINAMNQIQADTVFYLTQSFRFGPEIAQVAMSCLEVLKKEKKKTLVGSGKKSCLSGEKVGQLAIICRCNFTVFSEAVKKCCYSDEECKVAFVGGTENFGFPMLMDMYALTLGEQERQKEGYEIRNKLIKMFRTFGELDAFATKAMDNELLGKIKIVKTYNHNLPQHIKKIDSKCVRDERQADYVFSTAHKAKGLEFSTVRVTDDFLGDPHMVTMVDMIQGVFQANDDGYAQPILAAMAPLVQVRLDEQQAKDEENLLYVAVTRAKNALQMSSILLGVLKRAGERFEFPVFSRTIQDSGQVFKCMQTDAEFKPYCLTLEKKTITLGDGQQKSGGLYSPAFLSEDFNSFAGLLGLLDSDKVKEDKKELTIHPQVFFPQGFDADNG